MASSASSSDPPEDAIVEVEAKDAYGVLDFKQWSDPQILEPFLIANFDEAKFLADALVQSSAATLDRLNAMLEQIDNEIRSQVITNHADLLANAAHIGQIEAKLTHVAGQIGSLKQSVQSTKASLLDPYLKLSRLSVRLKNMQKLAVLLRQCLRLSQLNDKLQGTMSQKSKITRDYVRAAHSYKEVQLVLNETNLTGIDSIDVQLEGIELNGQEIRSKAETLLWDALTGPTTSQQNSVATDIGGPLQIFLNLGETELAKALQTLFDRVLDNVKQDIRTCFDLSALSHADKNNTPSRQALWTKMEGLTDQIFNHILQMYKLDREVGSKRDVQTHALMREILEAVMRQHVRNDTKKLSLLYSFWKQSCKTMAQEFEAAAKSSSFLRSVLVSEYPRLSELWLKFGVRVNTTAVGADKEPILGASVESRLTKTLSSLERAFLSRRVTQLNEPVQAMFPVGAPALSIPSPAALQNLMKAISTALQHVKGARPSLHVSVANCVNKVVLLFASRLEGMLTTTMEASPFPPIAQASPNKANKRGAAASDDTVVSSALKANAQIFSICLSLRSDLIPASLERNHPFLGPEAMAALEPCAGSLLKVATQVLELLSNHFLAGVQPNVFSLLKDDWSKGCSMHPDGSIAIQKLRPQCVFFRTKVVPLLRPTTTPSSSSSTASSDLETKELILKHLLMLTGKFASLYLFTASLISPLHEKAAMKLASDLTSFESIMAQVGPKLRRDKDKDALVRTGAFARTAWFKELIFAKPDQLQGLAASTALSPSSLLNTHDLKTPTVDDRTILMQALLSSCGASNITSTSMHALLHKSVEQCYHFMSTSSDAARHAAFTKAYAAVESRINIPKGAAGRNFIQNSYPRLYLVTTLLKVSDTGTA
eukprot:gb/GEZN01001921.1/.p1 GENE.gb/GEZN01001921.1/~~gb/GEZN01001921.1/.p1  ORF type:complete len:883 (-),score=120.70 gb/GEZN01001921.1/:7-2655(-)